MAVPILLPIIGFSVLSVLVSYVAIRLYRSREDVLPIPVSSFKLGRATWWDCRKSLTWTWPTSQKKAKPSKHIPVDLLPITGLPPPPTALPTPPLVDVSSASIPRPSSPPTSFYPHKNKQIHGLLPTSFCRPPSPHALFTTTVLQKPRRSRSLGGVPVRRLSGGASGLRNVQFLGLDVEMQEMDRGTSREHLLIDFSSSGSSDELDALRRENAEDGILSRRISPASSDIGILPFHHRPSFSDDAEVPLVDLAPGRKVLPLVDLDDVEDGLGVKQKEEDTWKWFVPTLSGKIHESTPASSATPISKSISEPLPTTPLPLVMSEGKPIDLHTGPDQEHVLVDLDVQDDNNVPQHHEFVSVHTTRVDLDAAVTKVAVPLDDPITVINSTTSDLEESNQRGRRVDRHPLEDIEKAEGTVEDKEQDNQALVIKHEPYDHHDADKLQRHSPQLLDTIRASSLSPQLATIPVQAAPVWYWDHEDDPWNGAVGVVDGEGDHYVAEALSGEKEMTEEHGGVEENHEKEVDLMEAGLEVENVVKVSSALQLAVESSLEEVPTEKLEDDEKRVDLMEAGLEVGEDEGLGEISSALELPVESSLEEVPTEKAEEEDQKGLDLMEAGLEDGKDENMSSELELSVESSLEEVPSEMEDDQSYPDPDYLPLPQLLLGSSNIPLILIEQHGLPDSFQEDEKKQDGDQQQQSEDDESSIRATTQMPTPPASPPPASPLHVQGLMRSGPPSPNSSPPLALSPLSTSQLTSPKLALSLVLTPNTASLFPAIEKIKVENTEVDKENGSPNSATGRPLWSIRADDAPALGMAASSLSTTSSDGSIPGVGTNMGVSPRMRRRVLGDVTTVVENEEKEKHMLKEEKDDDDEESSLPGAFPELVKTSDIIAPTITIAALTSTLLSTSIAAASSSITTPLSTSTAFETPLIKRRPITRSPLDIALAMQLRPGLGVGADPAWMVRFLMTMFGWFAILLSGQGEF